MQRPCLDREPSRTFTNSRSCSALVRRERSAVVRRDCDVHSHNAAGGRCSICCNFVVVGGVRPAVAEPAPQRPGRGAHAHPCAGRSQNLYFTPTLNASTFSRSRPANFMWWRSHCPISAHCGVKSYCTPAPYDRTKPSSSPTGSLAAELALTVVRPYVVPTLPNTLTGPAGTVPTKLMLMPWPRVEPPWRSALPM